uniref:Uncharacterized protein n=1 Tax=Schistocephalus solidus TaxID=70667 RepID=A0A0X3PSL0_SCHSO
MLTDETRANTVVFLIEMAKNPCSRNPEFVEEPFHGYPLEQIVLCIDRRTPTLSPPSPNVPSRHCLIDYIKDPLRILVTESLSFNPLNEFFICEIADGFRFPGHNTFKDNIWHPTSADDIFDYISDLREYPERSPNLAQLDLTDLLYPISTVMADAYEFTTLRLILILSDSRKVPDLDLEQLHQLKNRGLIIDVVNLTQAVALDGPSPPLQLFQVEKFLKNLSDNHEVIPSYYFRPSTVEEAKKAFERLSVHPFLRLGK